MRIVVLDGGVVNPGDLSWDGLKTLGEAAVHDRTPRAEVIARAQGAEAVLVDKAVLDKPTIEALPQLRYIGEMATGYDNVDAEAAKAQGIPVSNVPGYAAGTVAQSVFALLLELTNRVAAYDQAVREGRWRERSMSFREQPLVALEGLAMGIVGFGHIGKAVAKLAEGFGMKLLAHTRTLPKTPPNMPVEFCALDELFARADVISLNCPLTPETRELADARRLALMKPAAFLINTARGGLIEEVALAAALNEDRIAGAALDVLAAEPPPAGNPLLSARHCIITPHVAWASVNARRRLLAGSIDNLRSFLNGKPANIVNP
ncbi:MAG TPA: D-2-hydroxyacid dehydrogenase [Alphaproteobacteria bacterium]|nr:D-2-hydroxyacid dehydrogenase [Alphaproteobacteria bacterium]